MSDKVGEREHALLSASGAHRWLVCTPCARLEETFPEKSTKYTEEGRLAHAIAELELNAYWDQTPMYKRAESLEFLESDPGYSAEMLRHAQSYVDYIAQQAMSYDTRPTIRVEERVDYSAYAPEGFGTADCLILASDVLHVIDYKYGKGKPVYADQNPQLRLYALGAYKGWSWLYDIKTIKYTIYQPRIDNLSEYEEPITTLLSWGDEVVKPAAKRAFAGEGDYVSGSHCGFCRAKALCRARADFHLQLEDYGYKDQPLLADAEVGSILIKARNLASWVRALEDYALKQCLEGHEIPGWKAVEGRRVRRFKDQDQAFDVLKIAGYDEAMLYKREPQTLAQIEKLIGKTRFNELLTPYVAADPGKPTLVTDTDKRNPVSHADYAATTFADYINEESV